MYIFKIVLLFAQVFSSIHTYITNQDDVEQGFCHLQDVNLDVDVECGPHFNVSVIFSVVSSDNGNNENELLSCFRKINSTWMCHPSKVMTGAQNPFKDTLDIRFTFDNSIYGGQFLRTKMWCYNRPRTEYILLKACVSGFSANSAFYGDSSVIINCQHSSFHCSLSPIRIKSYGTDEEYGACIRNSCHGNGCRKLPNGIQCILPYKPDNRYQCVMDGAFFNISEPIMPEITHTSLESSAIPKTTQSTPLEGLAPTSSSYQDITSTESPASKGTTLQTAEMSKTSQGTTKPASASSEREGISGEKRILPKANLSLIIATLFLIHIYMYYINYVN